MANQKCPYFGNCGGCSLQHVGYTSQVENKKKALANALSGVGFDGSLVKVFSDGEYFYRNRMDMVFHPSGLGFRKKGDFRRVVDVAKCFISEERLNWLIKEVREFFCGDCSDSFDLIKHSGTFRYAVIRTPGGGSPSYEGRISCEDSGPHGNSDFCANDASCWESVSCVDSSISFVLNGDSTRLDEAVAKIRLFAQKTTANNVIVAYVPSNSDVSVSEDFFVVKGGDMLKANLLGREFLFSVQGFFQNNTKMAEKMHKYIHELFQKYDTGSFDGTRGAELLDLYGGVGTFGVNNADLFKKVTIVESFAASVETAKLNIENNKITNATAVALDARYLKRLNFLTPLFVLLDPPRSWMHPKTIECLRKLKPKVIVYISCNVEQLRKDVVKFNEYKIKNAAMFDLFPQTNHMESVVTMELK